MRNIQSSLSLSSSSTEGHSKFAFCFQVLELEAHLSIWEIHADQAGGVVKWTANESENVG